MNSNFKEWLEKRDAELYEEMRGRSWWAGAGLAGLGALGGLGLGMGMKGSSPQPQKSNISVTSPDAAKFLPDQTPDQTPTIRSYSVTSPNAAKFLPGQTPDQTPRSTSSNATQSNEKENAKTRFERIRREIARKEWEKEQREREAKGLPREPGSTSYTSPNASKFLP